MLRITITGNLGAEPEMRYTAKGSAVLSFRVAANQRLRDKDGEYFDDTRWFRCRMFGDRATSMSERLEKGMRVLIVGGLQISDYQDRNGDTKTGYDVMVDGIEIIVRPDSGNGRGRQDDEDRAPAPAPARSGGGGNKRPPADDADLEDLPF